MFQHLTCVVHCHFNTTSSLLKKFDYFHGVFILQLCSVKFVFQIQ